MLWRFLGPLGFGALASGAMLFVLVRAKQKELERRVAVLQSGVGTDELARQSATLQTELAAYGKNYAEQLAARTGKSYLLSRLGLTESQLERLSRLF